MRKVVIREIPEIVEIDKKELTTSDIFRMTWEYKMGMDEFVILPHKQETIYINKEFSEKENLKNILNEIMGRKYLDAKTEKLLDKMGETAGEKAAEVALYAWSDWREKRMEVERKEEAEALIRRIRRERVPGKGIKYRDSIQGVFEVGSGVYEETETKWERGAEYVFMYGYLCCRDDMRKKVMLCP